MKRLKRIANSNDITKLISENMGDILDVVDFSSEHEGHEGYTPSWNEWDGGDPGCDAESYTFGDCVFTLDIGKLENITGEKFNEQEINEYINSLKSCTNPKELENIIGSTGYDLMEFYQSKNTKDDEITITNVKFKDNVITVEFDYTFDGPWSFDDDDDDEAYDKKYN